MNPTVLIDGVHVVLAQVRSDSQEPRYRRTVYWNLPAAQRAVDRAHMAGKDAHIILCQLRPVEAGEPTQPEDNQETLWQAEQANR
ncbi:hypothetical protein GCM10009596_23510 [Arthrobacter rhombi]|uniref:hypothetical protein n=1 Tax=Arthrobacter rhombi TaxID=71253 RepID=UPI0031D0ECC5